MICRHSCDLDDGVTLDKVALVYAGGDVFGVLTEGQSASLNWSPPRTAIRSVTTLRPDVAIGVRESQYAMVPA